MTDPKALREKLDAMVRNNLTPSILNCYQTQYASARQVVLESISLTLLAENQTLLREKEERDTPCVWSVDEDGILRPACSKKRWHQAEADDAYCSGCGHPVQVKQKEADNPLDKCPECGGPADNGFDRCLPPSPYFCTKCSEQPSEDSHD